jgi:hypothetical protein
LRSAGTLAGNDNEWCYVSARRFSNRIEESVKKPTYAITWIQVTSMTKNFLTQKWCDGGRQGTEQVDFLASFAPPAGSAVGAPGPPDWPTQLATSKSSQNVNWISCTEPWGGQNRTCYYNDPGRDLSPRSTRRSRSAERLGAWP